MVLEAGERFYFKAEGDGLLVSPADETPAEPGDARPDEVDVAIALERVEDVTGLGLRSVRDELGGAALVRPGPRAGGRRVARATRGSGSSRVRAGRASRRRRPGRLAAAVITGGRCPPTSPSTRRRSAPSDCRGCG